MPDSITAQDLEKLDNAEISKLHWKIMLVSGMGFFTDAYDLFIIGVVMAMIKPVWHPSPVEVGLVTSTALLASAVGAVLFGRVADLLGRKRIYGVEVLVLAAGAIASALSPGIVWLILFRVILGLGIGGDYPVSATIMGEFAGKKSRGMLISLVFAMQAAGLIFGPLFAAALLAGHVPNSISWRILLGFGAVPALAVYWARRHIDETPRFKIALEKRKEMQKGAVCAEGDFWRGYACLTGNRRWLIRLIGVSFAWFLMDFAYYGNTVSSPLVLGALAPHASLLKHTLTQLEVFVIAAAPGYFVAAITMDRLGRKFIQVLGFLVMAVAFFGIALISGIEKEVLPFLLIYGLSYFFALASDYDGTLAHDGVVDEQTLRTLERLVQSGRKLILVTGRELADLQSVFPRLDLCERIVAENGAVLYNPATREKTILAERPPESFIESLRNRGVNNMSVGDVIVATWHPFEQQALEAIREAGLELHVIFNKDAVMILPSGTNKMTGLGSALEGLKLSRHNVIGVGDAENDHAFLNSCECAVAVVNAIPALKERADLVTTAARGAGVAELIGKLIENDASDIVPRCDIEGILVGKSSSEIRLPAYGRNLLICGQSGSGKSTFVTALLERITNKNYQMCLVDPEGDYENLPGCRTVGDEKHAPSIEHVQQVLQDPDAQVVVNLVGVPSADRSVYFSSLISELQRCRLEVGRPHWLLIDEAHHVLPGEWAFTQTALPEELSNLLLITVHPEHVSRAVLRRINTMIVLGREPRMAMEQFAKAVGTAIPDAQLSDLPRGEALLWLIDERQVIRFKTEPPRTEHFRHRRKYAEGQLEDQRRFRFRGLHDKMDLSVQNLNMFVQVAEGIDAETWQFHLQQGDYSKWFRNGLKDPELADQIAAIEKEPNVPDRESRKRIKEAIMQKYAAPA